MLKKERKRETEKEITKERKKRKRERERKERERERERTTAAKRAVYESECVIWPKNHVTEERVGPIWIPFTLH
jgi:hypothetical protein